MYIILLNGQLPLREEYFNRIVLVIKGLGFGSKEGGCLLQGLYA